MSKTVGQIINFVDQMLPNVVDTTTKMIFIEDIFKSIKEYNINYVRCTTSYTSSTTPIISLPTGVDWKDLIYVGLSPTTYNSTNVVGATTPFEEYTYRPDKNVDMGMNWWEYTSSSIVLSKPDDAYHIDLKYLPSLICSASSDSTTLIPANDEIVDYIQNKLASQVAKFGSFPRIDLANNYEMEAQDLLNKVKIESKKFKWRRRNTGISYKEWW